MKLIEPKKKKKTESINREKVQKYIALKKKKLVSIKPCDCSPGNLAFVDLQTPFGHVAHSLLTLFAAVHGEVVDVGSLISHLKVADAAVPLPTKNPTQTKKLPLPIVKE